jgi:hypothetical protein
MKMKKVLLMLAFMVIGTTTVLANQNWGGYFVSTIPACVQFQLANDNDVERPVIHHVPPLLPELGYDGNTFVLSVPYELEDVTIVIRDEDGLVLYYDVVSSITDYYMFLLTDDIIADMYSIELYYGDWHLYGEF